jgi:hypothetical protein
LQDWRDGLEKNVDIACAAFIAGRHDIRRAIVVQVDYSV